MKFDARDFLSSSSFSRSSALAVFFARVNEKNVCVRKFLDRRKRATEFEAKRRRLPKAGRRFVFSLKVKPLSSLSLFRKENENRKKSYTKPNSEKEFSVLPFCVCVCVFACCFLLSLCV
jgi:hypothetical protein